MRHDGDVAPGEQGEDDDDGPGIGLTRGVANRIASVRPSQLRISPSEGQVAIARSVGLIRSIDIVIFLLLLVASNYLTQSQASLQPKCGGLGRASRPGGARQPAWRRNRDTIGVPHGTPAGEVPPQRSSHPPPPLVRIMCRPRPTHNASRKGACECIWGMAQAWRVLPPRVAVDWTCATRHHTTSFPRALPGLTDSQLQPRGGVPFFPLPLQHVPLPALASSCTLIRVARTIPACASDPCWIAGRRPSSAPMGKGKATIPCAGCGKMHDGRCVGFSVLVVQSP